ncbi:MAG: prolipoprotein diacylglyceryl transferase [Spirochaetes bacterium]|nr:prolipoprotein diacylglyceryl transferase [Spirochaetota bacterium]MBX3723812.1 prolipoprotein diacylglyceryl transferase [Turneriella sp.]
MHPVLFSIEVSGYTRSFTSYGVIAVTGIFVASFLIVYLARQRGIETFDMVNILALLVVGGIIVSLITHFFIFLPQRLAGQSFWALHFGVVSWGGVLGGFLAGILASRWWKIPFLKLADIVIPGVALGFAFGRVGCHFAGCCYGLHYEGPLALHFMHPQAPAAIAAQPLFPIQLTSAALLLLLSLILLHLLRLRLPRGFVLATYAVLYGLGRFVVEFFRDDARGVWLRLSDAQWYSVFLFAAGVILIYYRARSKEAYGH